MTTTKKSRLQIQQMTNPTPAQVTALREQIQANQACGITAAQTWCAQALHTSLRAYQHWERGERAMHPALFELLQIKVHFCCAQSKTVV